MPYQHLQQGMCKLIVMVHTFYYFTLGKTTILKKFNGEDITEIAPTLGFNIKTLEHR